MPHADLVTNHGLTITEAGRADRPHCTHAALPRAGRPDAGVDRARSGHRPLHRERDLGWIDLITKLRATGMPIREIRRYAQMVRDGADNERERRDFLAAHRDRVRQSLTEATEHLAAIERKIDY